MSHRRPGSVPKGQRVGSTLMGLTVVAGLVGALLIGMPALSPEQSTVQHQKSEASEGR